MEMEMDELAVGTEAGMFNGGMELQCGQRVLAGLSLQPWKATHHSKACPVAAVC